MGLNDLNSSIGKVVKKMPESIRHLIGTTVLAVSLTACGGGGGGGNTTPTTTPEVVDSPSIVSLKLNNSDIVDSKITVRKGASNTLNVTVNDDDNANSYTVIIKDSIDTEVVNETITDSQTTSQFDSNYSLDTSTYALGVYSLDITGKGVNGIDGGSDSVSEKQSIELTVKSNPVLTIADVSVNDDGGGSGNLIAENYSTGVLPGAVYSVVPDDSHPGEEQIVIDSTTGRMTRTGNTNGDTDYLMTIKVVNPDSEEGITSFTMTNKDTF